jgi:hypothetical protein
LAGTANRRISKDGFAPAAPEVARRVTQSYLKLTDFTASTFDILFFTVFFRSA